MSFWHNYASWLVVICCAKSSDQKGISKTSLFPMVAKQRSPQKLLTRLKYVGQLPRPMSPLIYRGGYAKIQGGTIDLGRDRGVKSAQSVNKSSGKGVIVFKG